LLVSVVVMPAAPASSFGQALPSDPEADSPSGVVYELPVDRARQDAAPRRDTPARAPQGGGGEGSSIRSENNFGTSSNVPGATKRRKRSGNGAGSSHAGTSGGDAAGDAVRRAAAIGASTTATADGPSDGVVYPLLAALLAVGAGIGVVAGRRALRGRRGD